MLTITGHEGKSTFREDYFDGCFPNRDREQRPYRFNKVCVFLSARVHPGEVPSSHVLNGLIKFLTDEYNPISA